MEDSLSIIVAIVVALIIMFIVPLMDTWELQDNLSYVVTYAAVTDFVDTCRNVGFISIENYNDLVATLNSTGNTFAISIEHRDEKPIINSDGTSGAVYINTYTNTILEYLHKNKIYPLSKYDYLYVTVKNTNITQASIITKMVASDTTNFKIGCAYGGCVWSTGGEVN